MEVTGQRRALEGDLHELDQGREQRRSLVIAGCAQIERALYARIVGMGVQEEIGATIVAACAQVIVAGADLVPTPQLIGRLAGDPIGKAGHGVVPAVIVAGLDLLGDRDDFAEQGGAVLGRAEQAFDLEPELRIVFEDQGFGAGVLKRLGFRPGGGQVFHRGNPPDCV
jgi:hypothetical protein